MKDVLAVLAERATAEGLSHPSASYIAGKTGYHLRTVQQVLEALALAELIAHTGQMTGRTGRVKVWQLGPLTVLADTAGNASTDGSVMRVQTGGNASTNPDLMRVQTGGNASTRNAGTSGNAELSVVDRKALSVGDRTRVPAHTREAPIPPPPSPQNDGPGQPSAEVLEVDPMAADIDSGPLPPRYCPDHPKGTRDPCAACGDARERRQLEERRRKRAADSLLYRFEEIRLDTRNCPHGEPGGYLIHPKHRKPHKCGLCRALYRTAGEDLDLYRAELAEAWRIEAAR